MDVFLSAHSPSNNKKRQESSSEADKVSKIAVKSLGGCSNGSYKHWLVLSL